MIRRRTRLVGTLPNGKRGTADELMLVTARLKYAAEVKWGARRDVLVPRGHEHEGAPSVREGADHTRAPAYLAVETLDGVVCADPAPALAGAWCISFSPWFRRCIYVEHDPIALG